MDKYIVNKDAAVLLLIDLQEKLMQTISTREAICKNVNILLKSAQILQIPVVLTEQYPRGLGETLPDIKQNAGMFHYVEKVRFSAFVPELQGILEKIGRKKIIVTGIETHICVYQTARDLIKNGYDVHVLKDASGSRNDENYHTALKLMLDIGAVITTTETVLFDMLKTAASPEFKQISALVK